MIIVLGLAPFCFDHCQTRLYLVASMRVSFVCFGWFYPIVTTSAYKLRLIKTNTNTLLRLWFYAKVSLGSLLHEIDLFVFMSMLSRYYPYSILIEVVTNLCALSVCVLFLFSKINEIFLRLFCDKVRCLSSVY